MVRHRASEQAKREEVSGKWRDSNRRAELPADWHVIRAKVRSRAGGQCEATLPSGKRCPRPGTDAHHAGGRDNHDWRAMQWLCSHHHAKETAREARAKPAKPVPRHPGDRV